MKNQYFGDINDYYKYCLLRQLNQQLNLGVCWMLTADDQSRDGRKIKYLNDPQHWRHHDPVVFDQLQRAVIQNNIRHIQHAETILLPEVQFCSVQLTDDLNERQVYFKNMQSQLADSDLIFFDPDNGIEVASRPYGKKYAHKYLYWREINACYQNEQSLVIYQHLPRINRTKYLHLLAQKVFENCGTPSCYMLFTSSVAFIAIPQSTHQTVINKILMQQPQRWQNKMRYDSFNNK